MIKKNKKNSDPGYFSCYNFKNVKDSNLIDILIFLFIGVYFYAMSIVLGYIIRDVFYKNFPNYFINNLYVLVLSIALFIILIVYLMAQHEKYKWLMVYLIMLLMLIGYSIIDNKLLGILLFLFILFLILPIMNRWWKKPKWHLIIVGLIILLVLIFGLLLISEVYGTKQIILHLNKCNASKRIIDLDIECKGIGDKAIEGYLIKCNPTKKMEDINGEIGFTFFNGSSTKISFNKSISFIAPSNIERIGFLINGTLNEELICVSTGGNYRFVTKEEYYQNREKFITYFLALLFLSLITIPKFYFNIKKEIISGTGGQRKKKEKVRKKMKGKEKFTKDESKIIMNLLDIKVNSPKNEQKGIRNKLRNIGFYITDFDQSHKGFTREDFELLVEKHVIIII